MTIEPSPLTVCEVALLASLIANLVQAVGLWWRR